MNRTNCKLIPNDEPVSAWSYLFPFFHLPHFIPEGGKRATITDSPLEVLLWAESADFVVPNQESAVNRRLDINAVAGFHREGFG